MKRKSIVSTKHNQKKKEKKTQIILGIVIAAIMIFSVFGLAFGGGHSGTNTVTENGQRFSIVQVQGQQVWQTNLDRQQQNFLYLPSQVEYIPANFNRDILNTAGIVLGFNPNQDNLDVVDFARFIFTADLETKAQVSATAVTNLSENYPNLLLIDCEIATVIFEYANDTQIIQDNQCIRVQGQTPARLIEGLERLRFIFYGVSE